ncbi:MAG TPA: TonB-dependent receptor, partial [Candidatus Latescibacteria bacterium]|nr:TonB-dependent receptor [Candidatus Latescibacterota bacterium]
MLRSIGMPDTPRPMHDTRNTRPFLDRVSSALPTLFLALCPIGTFADSGDSLATYTAEEVVITGVIPPLSSTAVKLPLPLSSTPASVSVIEGRQLERQDAVVLGDALVNASGVNVQTGFGVHDFFVVRGFGSLANGLVLTDGAAEPEATFYNLYNLERVEVLKGPGAFLYGANPLSGTVNLVRKQAVFGPAFGRVSASVGRFGSFRATTDLGWSDAESGVALRLNGLWRRSDSYRDGKEHWSAALNPTLTWRLSESSKLRLNLEYAANDYNSDSGLPITGQGQELAAVPRQRSYQSPFDDSEQDIFRLRLDFETQLTERVSLRDKLYFTDFDWPSSGTLFNGVSPDGLGGQQLLRSLLLLDDHQTFFGNQLEAVLTFGRSGLGHTLLAGVETAWQGDEFSLDVGLLPPVDLNDPVETA